MATRRVLIALIGLLSACIAAGLASVAALLLFGRWQAPGERLLVVGPAGQLLVLEGAARGRVLAEDASPDLFRYPTLAPGGERAAYISQDGEGFALWSLDLRSGERTELYRSRENPPLYAAWSPDGANISFLSNRSAGGLGVHIVAADGSAESAMLGTSRSSSYFAWQPDGDRILLHLGGSTFEQGRVAAFDLGSSTPVFELADPGLFQAPAWTADGSGFFYVAQPPVSGQPTPDRIESVLTRVGADGTGPRELARERQAAMLFLRSPRSDDIAYTTIGQGGFGGLKLVAAAGGPARTLSLPDEQVPAFFWAPDGERLAYLTLERSSAGEPFRFTWNVVDRAGGQPRQLASFTPSQAFAGLVNFFDAYALSFDLWSGDGRRIVYGASDGVYVLDVASGAAERRADGVLAMWAGRR